MINKYPLWKYLIILAVVLPGLIYSLPNIFGDDPGLQIRGSRSTDVGTETLGVVEKFIAEAGIGIKSALLDLNGIKIRFNNTEDQLKAKGVLESSLKGDYTIALNLLPATPGWLEAVGGKPMYLGLDLRGGVHFLMEVDFDSLVDRTEERYVGDIRTLLRENKIRHQGVRRLNSGGLEVRFKDDATREKARFAIESEIAGFEYRENETDGKVNLIVRQSARQLKELSEFALEQNMTALRNRIDELGVAEPVVQKQGDRRIVVQLPGVQDTSKAKQILSRLATLEVKMVDEEHDLQGALGGNVPAGSEILKFRDGRSILLNKRVIYSGDNIVDAAASVDSQNGSPIVAITLDSRGGEINKRITGKNIGKRMAVVFIEEKIEDERDEQGNPIFEDGKRVKVKSRIEEVITAPVIRDQLGRRFQIEGLDSIAESRDLALLLRAGAFVAPVQIIEERTVGPSLGQQNIDQGFLSTIVGFALVLIFMALYYRTFGAVANIALALNLIVLVAVMSMLQATLTLPGVAGIVLTVGMAVDANVLIFERIREELRNGNTPQASIHVGYDRAFSTIVDANITTLIAAIVLFNFGTGPIKGFAITLSIGIATSMFTAIILTRGLINLIYGGKRVSRLSI